MNDNASSASSSSSSSPIHTALSNPDLLELILENLAVDQVWETPADEVIWRRRSLLSAALTNKKVFLEPSLDRLWRSLDKLFPLFRLLPAFYRSDSTFVLRGGISRKDWDRFDWYARRVKSFCYSRDPDSLDIAMHVYFRIAQLRKQPLLPCLRQLKCPHISQDDFLISSICLFLAPSLRILDFEKITGVEDKLIGTFLHTLLDEGARIERIVVVGEGLTRDSLEYLGRCGDLKSLVVSGMGRHIGMDVIRSLGRLPGLEELDLDLEESGLLSVNDGGGGVVFGSSLSDNRTLILPSTSSSLSSSLPSNVVDGSSGSGGGAGVGVGGTTVGGNGRNGTSMNGASGSGSGGGGGGADLGFRELVKLELVAPLSFVKTFLMSIGTNQLRHVGFESSIGGAIDRRELMNYIGGRWKDVLVYCRLVHNAGVRGGEAEEEEEEVVPPSMTMDILAPLLDCSKLGHLEIDGYSLELTDANVSDMANAWPEIHTLHLPMGGGGGGGGGGSMQQQQRPSMVSLQVLSKRCRKLCYLTLGLDTTTTTSDVVVGITEPRRVCRHQLRELTISNGLDSEGWELRRAMELARVIDLCFPFVGKVHGPEGVPEMVRLCQSVRNDVLLEQLVVDM